MNKKLSCPYARRSIQCYLKNLLNEEVQKTWPDPNYKHAFWDSLYLYVFESLYDETDEAVGASLYNKEEENFLKTHLKEKCQTRITLIILNGLGYLNGLRRSWI